MLYTFSRTVIGIKVAHSWLDDFDFFFFDFDGLLVNTEELHFRAYQETCKLYGCLLDWDFSTYCVVGHHSTEALRDAIYSYCPSLKHQEGDWEKVRTKKIAIYERLLNSKGVKLMSGVEEMLEYVQKRGALSCVVTNSPNHHLELIKNHLPLLKKIPHWVGRSDYQFPKPNPDGYLKALAKHLTKETNPIGFEDTTKGLKALEQTPIFPVLISDLVHEGLQEVSKTTLRFSSFHEALSYQRM